VVAIAAAAPRLSLRGRAVTGEVRAPTRDAPRSLSAVPLCVAEVLAALALKWTLWRHVRLHRNPQTAELGERVHSGHLRNPCHRHNEVEGGRTVLGRILVAASGSELHDSLDTNVQGLQLLPDGALRHSFAHILHE